MSLPLFVLIDLFISPNIENTPKGLNILFLLVFFVVSFVCVFFGVSFVCVFFGVLLLFSWGINEFGTNSRPVPSTDVISLSKFIPLLIIGIFIILFISRCICAPVEFPVLFTFSILFFSSSAFLSASFCKILDVTKALSLVGSLDGLFLVVI